MLDTGALPTVLFVAAVVFVMEKSVLAAVSLIPTLISPAIAPAELKVAVVSGVWRVCDPPPVTKAVLVKFPEPTTVTVPLPPPGGTSIGC